MWEEEEWKGREGKEKEGKGGRRQLETTASAAIGDINVNTVSMLFLGRLGKHKLAGGSLSIGFANITCYSIFSGLALGMEPIPLLAFRAKKYSLMSHPILILLLAYLSISILWLKMKPILLLCGQDPISTFVTSTYLAFSLPSSSSSSLAPLFFPGASFFLSYSSLLFLLLLLCSLPSSSSVLPFLPFLLLPPFSSLLSHHFH